MIIKKESKQKIKNTIMIIKQNGRYNREYWSLHGHKYIKQRSEDLIYKANQRLYYEKYYEKYKVKENPVTIKDRLHTTQDDLIVIFKFSF
jgi:hypothetical protein